MPEGVGRAASAGPPSPATGPTAHSDRPPAEDAGRGQAVSGPAAKHGYAGKRALFAALAANLGIAITKFVAFAITGSASMLAEAVHSVADSGNEVLLLVGRTRSQREETREHPFGFGSERYFYTFIVAVVLFTVGALFSCYEGAERIRHPEHLTKPAVAFGVLAVAAVLEGLSLRTAVRETRGSRGQASLISFIRHAKIPELPAVLLEDVAALTGLLLALIGVTVATLTNNDRWDGAGSIGVGVVLGCVAAVLAIEMKSLLIGESATRDTEAAIVAAIAAGPDVRSVIHLRTLHLGPDTLLVAAKIAVRNDETAASVAVAIDAAERRIRAAVPIAQVIFLEPDIYQARRADPDDPAVQAVTDGAPHSTLDSSAHSASESSADSGSDSSAQSASDSLAQNASDSPAGDEDSAVS